MQSPQAHARRFEFQCRARLRESADPRPPARLRRAVAEWRRLVAANPPCWVHRGLGGVA